MRPDEAASPLSIRLFGPFEVRVNGRPLPPLRFRKSQAVLALLAMRQGCEVSRDWLAGLLWPDSDPAAALHSLRNCLTVLRQALGPEASRLHSPTSRTLCLDLTGAAVDVFAFDAALARGDPEALAEAVSLYRGPLLEGCAEYWVFQERQSRQEACLGTLETLAAQALSAGDPTAAERHLRRLVAADPLRETAQRALMQLLAAGGNYAAAVLVYRDLRLRLHREANSEPDPETTALFQQLRAAARGQAAAPPSAARRTASSLSRALPAAPDGPFRADDFPALPRLSAFPHNLPLQLTRFIGREGELAAVKALLATHRLVTLTGVGGGGKTRLALQVAADLLYGFADGVWVVELAPVRDPALVLPAVAAVFGVREEPGRPLLTSLTAFLQTQNLLLVLDNFEQVAAAAPQVLELLAGAPRVTVLATSRAPLHLHGEQEFPVPPLALPPVGAPLVGALSESEGHPQGSPQPLQQYAAVALFLQQAQAVKPEFALTEENAAAVAEICRRLDGLPLALELAAARVKLFSPQALLGRMASRLTLLTGGARDLPARHQTLRATIAWSYDLLAEEEKALFRRLCVFVGGCTLEAAEAVCEGCGTVLDGVASLVDQSLVRQEEEEDGEPRFGMLETIREFALECLTRSGEAERARQQHRDYFLGLAEEAEPELHGRRQGEWLARLEGEHDNLRAALAWCTERGEGEAGLRLGGALSRFWEVRGYLTEGRERIAGLLALPGAEARTEVRANALNMAGALAGAQGDYDAARAFLEQGLAIHRELGNHRGIAHSLGTLGSVALSRGDYEGARALYEESLALHRELGNHRGIAWLLYNLGCVAREEGDYEGARALLEEGLAIFRELGDHRGIAWSHRDLCHLAGCQGNYEAARALGEESLAIFRELGDHRGIASACRQLGRVAVHQEGYEVGRALLEEGLAIFRELGDQKGIVLSLAELGHLAREVGEYARCAAYYRESLALRQSRDDRFAIAQGLEEFAGLAGRQSQWERAVQLLGAAQGVVQTLGRSLPAAMRDEYQRTVDGARSALGEAAFTAAWAAGRAMSLEEAIRFALEDTTSSGHGQ